MAEAFGKRLRENDDNEKVGTIDINIRQILELISKGTVIAIKMEKDEQDINDENSLVIVSVNKFTI